jgi:hypothetical protein
MLVKLEGLEGALGRISGGWWFSGASGSPHLGLAGLGAALAGSSANLGMHILHISF